MTRILGPDELRWRRRRAKRGRIATVSVIGGAGYVGSLVVERLLRQGFTVTVLDTLMFGDESLRDLADHPRFGLVHGDLRDIEAIVHTCAGADAVIHLGALVGDPACAVDEATTLAINRDATLTVARVSRALGVQRLIFASTCSVYGASDDILTEESVVAPISVYARSKAESEQLLMPMVGDRFHPTVLRFGTLYGNSRRKRFDLVVNLLAARAVIDGEITITGGDQWRPFVHVSDCADAVIRCLHAPHSVVSGRVFNVGSNAQNHQLRDIGDLIKAMVPGARVIFSESASAEANYRVSFDRIERELGFRPSLTLIDGIKEIQDAVRQGLITDYTDARYSNYLSLVTGRAQLDVVYPTVAAEAGVG
jgi:nucleoside-diphosphate-sugar epimerase